VPDWPALLRPEVLIAAMGQAFFSLGIGMSVFITYASYMRAETNIPRTAGAIVAGDTLFAIVAGLAIFPAVFALGMDPGAGPELAFITLPQIFLAMPGGTLFGAAFFGLLVAAALTSMISLLEVPVASLVHRTALGRRRAVALVGAATFALGIPATMSFGLLTDVRVSGRGIFDFVDQSVSGYLLPAGGMLVALYVGWRWRRGAATDAADLPGTGPGAVWIWLLRIVAPVTIGFILFDSTGALKMPPSAPIRARARALALALVLAAALSLAPAPALSPAWAQDFRKGYDAYLRGDYAAAAREWEPLALQGDVKAMNNLGFLYTHGKGVARNPEYAVFWYRKAAAAGDARAAYNLGVAYEHGRGVVPDLATAIRWYARAADAGVAKAITSLAAIYAMSPDEAVRDGAEAVRWAERAVRIETTSCNLSVLAAAHAQAGAFDKAIAATERALDYLKRELNGADMIASERDLFLLARRKGRVDQVADLLERLEYYRYGIPTWE
jgi:TPR repeat protein